MAQKKRRTANASQKMAKEKKRLIMLLLLALAILIALFFMWRHYYKASRHQLVTNPVETTDKGKKEKNESDAEARGLLPDGVFVNGIDVSSLTINGALKKVDAQMVEDVRDRLFTFNFRRKNIELAGAELGIQVDYDSLREAFEELIGKTSPAELAVPLMLDAATFDKAVDRIAKALETEPENARSEGFNLEKREFEIVPGKKGFKLDRQGFKEEFVAMVESGVLSDSFNLELEAVEPEITEDDIDVDYVLLGSAYTNIPYYDPGRIQNLIVSADRINGTVLKPGEIFSFLTAMGEFSEANGWALAGMQADGVDTEGLGGGICQTSTTLFQAAVLAGLDVVEQHNHDLPSNYCNLGEDAMVAVGWADLKLINNLDGPVMLVGYYAEPAVVFEVYGPPREEGVTTQLKVVRDGMIEPGETEYRENKELAPGETKVYRPRIEGQKTTLYRYWVKDGEVIKSEVIAKNIYPAFSEVIEIGPTKTTTEEQKTTTTEEPWWQRDDQRDGWHYDNSDDWRDQGNVTPPGGNDRDEGSC